jgi:hypothetical protein
LSNNKACGIDGITYEHLKHGGKLLEKHLCNLFSMIFDKCVTPNVWKASMIIPLHKGGSKPKTEYDAYNLSKTKLFFDRTRANLLLDLMHLFHSFRSLFLVRLETDI